MSQESRLAEGEEANTPTQMPRCRGESKTFNNRLVRASWPITSPAQAGGGGSPLRNELTLCPKG